MNDFVVKTLLAGFGVAVVAGPLGAFVVWRRMAYFGDALSHAALLGVGLGLVLGMDPVFGVVVICVAVAVLLALSQRQKSLAGDTVLGIMAHATLAIGLVALAFLTSVRVDLMGLLLGDVLAVTTKDLWRIWVAGAGTLVVLAGIWRPLLAATVHEDLARVEGVPVQGVQLTLMVLMAIVIAIAMKVVGVLLITSLLIIPSAATRRFCRTPEQMAILAAVLGCCAVAIGIWLSFHFDTPAGPSIVVAETAIFLITVFTPGRSPGQ
ncbi:MAG TPA: iron chelate uptake ABC transporter family permease subunit [Alphaproteobacteria bacterium]|nr:iron chelate uptake ABC transporter family permease subunit [Alphaproteobacteria bacterium]